MMLKVLMVLYSLRRPSLLSNISRMLRKGKARPKNMTLYWRPVSWEHSSSHRQYLTRSRRVLCGRLRRVKCI